MEYEKSCGAVLFRLNNKEIEYLLLKSYNPNGYFGFAKGHVENLETEKETCIREVFEETGTKIIINNNFRESIKYKISNQIEKEVVLFLANITNQHIIIQEEEIEDYIWCSYKTALELIKFNELKNILIKANRFLENNKNLFV